MTLEPLLYAPPLEPRMIVIHEDRVRFEVAPDEADRRGLRIGARVLSVALHVKSGPASP